MWVHAAGAALSCLIILLAPSSGNRATVTVGSTLGLNNETRLGPREIVDRNAQTPYKFEPIRVAKEIPIENIPIYPQHSLVFHERGDGLRRKDTILPDVFENVLPIAIDHCVKIVPPFVLRAIRDSVPDKNFKTFLRNGGGRPTVIAEGNTDPWVLQSRCYIGSATLFQSHFFYYKPRKLDTNRGLGETASGSSRNLGRFDGPQYIEPLLVGNLPKSISGSPKCKCEHCDNHSRQCGYSSVVLASSDAGARSVQFQPDDRFDEQGAFFVKGLIGLMVLAVLYAVLKRF
jgi:hypothetical protein